MTNTTDQTEQQGPPEGGRKHKYISQHIQEADPPIISILREEDEDTAPPSDTLPDDTTPAELLTNKELTPEQKTQKLQRMWGKKGKRKAIKWKPEFIKVAQQLAAIGVPETDMAALFQVNIRTFRGWKRRHPRLTLALKEGDSMKRTNLTMQMQATAASGIFQMQMFLAKNWLGMTDRQDIRTQTDQPIIYKSYIPKEKGEPDVDPGSVKKTTRKIQDRE